jgi:hypothetical protein
MVMQKRKEDGGVRTPRSTDQIPKATIAVEIPRGGTAAAVEGPKPHNEIDMYLDTLKTQRNAILALGQRYGARHIRVFGSVARGEDRPDSDVDFLVDFPRGYDLFSLRLPLTDELSDLLGRRVDVVPEHELNRHIRERVLKEAVDL